jgi:hypothetical protein
VTPTTVVCGIYASALAQWSGDEAPCFVFPTDRRIRYPSLSSTFGNLIQSMLLRIHAGPHDVLQQVCERARDALLGVARHGDVPLEAVFESAKASLVPLVQAQLIVVQTQRLEFLGAAAKHEPEPQPLITAEPFGPAQPGVPRAALTVIFVDRPGCYTLMLSGRSRYMTEVQFETFVEHFDAFMNPLFE